MLVDQLTEAETGTLLQEMSRSFCMFNFYFLIYLFIFSLGHERSLIEETGDIYVRLCANLKMQSGIGVLVHSDPPLLPVAQWHPAIAMNLQQSFLKPVIIFHPLFL